MSKERIVIKRTPAERKERQPGYYEKSTEEFIRSLERERQLKVEEKERLLAELQEEVRPYQKKEADLQESFLKKNRRSVFKKTVFHISTIIFSLSLVISPDLRQVVLNQMTEARQEIGKYAFLNEDERVLAESLEKDLNAATLLLVQNLDSIQQEEQRAEFVEKSNFVRISGFEKFKIEGDILGRAVKETLPVGFTNNISSISYDNSKFSMQESYGSKIASEGSIEAAHVDVDARNIVFSFGSADESPEWIIGECLIHEVGHLNDWVSNSLLTRKERLILLKQIVERLKSADRYDSYYVERIENSDRRVEFDNKASEYFAEITKAYLSSNYFKLPEADKKIVENLIKQLDPKFNRSEALTKRMAIIRQAESQQVAKNIS